jgi:glucokinase
MDEVKRQVPEKWTKPRTSEELVLAGDVGGTKTNLGLFDPAEARPTLIAAESYASGAAGGLEELIATFLDAHPARVSGACFGVAGPVASGEARTTNLPWFVSEENLRNRFGWRTVSLINDLVATAYSVSILTSAEAIDLNPGRPDFSGSMGLVAPGTGLGMALAVWSDGTLRPVASEGGHMDFAPRNDLEIQLLRHLLVRMPHVSVERIVCGPGLFTIYSWLKEYRGHCEPTWLEERLRSADPPGVISEAALLEHEPLCVEALDLFVSLLGAAAGNLALAGLTTGGLWLAGGICPRILPKLSDGLFMQSFTFKGRFAKLLSDIPVRVIVNDKAALLGAARRAAELC